MRQSVLPVRPWVALRVLALVALGVFSAVASAQDVAPARVGADVETEPGASLDVYESDARLDRLVRPVAGQTPNVSEHAEQIVIGPNGVGGLSRRYYAEFTTTLLIDSPGRYEFELTSDDGSQLIIDDQIVIDNDGLHAMVTRLGAIRLEAGPVPLKVRYFQNEGGQGLELGWRPPGATAHLPIPLERMRTPAGLTRVVSPGAKRFIADGSPRTPGDGSPLESVHPMWDLKTLVPEDAPEGFDLKIAGMAYLGDGQLAIAVYDPRNNGQIIKSPNGKVWLLRGVDGDPEEVTVSLAAEGFINPLGLLYHDGGLFVAQRDEITRLDDADGDGVFETRKTIASGWISNNYHHFTFGPVFLDGYLYATLSTSIGMGGQKLLKHWSFGTVPNAAHRGSVMKIDPKTGDIEYIAGGLRTPNGLFVHDGKLFVGENQGAWMPSNKLNHLQPGRFYGHYNGNALTEAYPDGAPPADFADQPLTPPAVYLPQGEIANSPTDGVTIPYGPFAGQILMSDVKHGGLRRIALEEVEGELQGVAFRHSQGFNAGLNRLAFGENGELYVGGIGERKSWSWRGTTAGLQRLEPTGDTSTFEYKDITATPDGLLIRFTHPVDPDMAGDLYRYQVQQWRYRPTSAYGGPKFDRESLAVSAAEVADDGLSVRLTLPGMKSGRVIYLNFKAKSSAGQPIWSPEAWYTMNRIPGQPEMAPEIPLVRMLLFTKTAGHRHANIPDGVKAIRILCSRLGIDLIHTADARLFNDEDLAKFDLVMFFNTTGDILNDEQQAAFERFIQAGNGFVGIHAATDAEYGWPWYTRLVGAQFAGHSKVVPAEMNVVVTDHPSTRHLPKRWARTDEWFRYKAMNPDEITVLIEIDETSYEGGNQGEPRPIAWYHEYDGGRAWYTGGGHTKEAFAEPDFMQHLAGGIRWAAGMTEYTSAKK
ncbi:MAG: ThuA domain-containing protein [Planctomycetota bacterium]